MVHLQKKINALFIKDAIIEITITANHQNELPT